MDIEDTADILYHVDLGAMICSGVLMIVGSKNNLIAPFQTVVIILFIHSVFTPSRVV